jgi:hypothetical protein
LVESTAEQAAEQSSHRTAVVHAEIRFVLYVSGVIRTPFARYEWLARTSS